MESSGMTTKARCDYCAHFTDRQAETKTKEGGSQSLPHSVRQNWFQQQREQTQFPQ